MKSLALLYVFLVILLHSSFGFSTIVKRDHVELQLFADRSAASIAVHFNLDPEWHIYWKNPGDSGAAPKFNLIGGDIKKISWPYPVRIPVGHLTNFGYKHEVAFLLQIAPQIESMKLKLEWLVCKVECIPGFQEFDFTMNSLPENPVIFQKYWARIPQQQWDGQINFITQNEKTFDFELKFDDISTIKSVHVFPENGELFQTEAPKIEIKDNAFLISVPYSANVAPLSEPAFTFVLENIHNDVISFSKVIIPKPQASSWLTGMLLAFIGGLLLNLMPCVFPIIFLKAYGFLKEPDFVKIKQSSWAYVAGVVLTFFLFGSLLTLLRLTGFSIGWGYQLQNPIVVYLLSLLFFLMALNFFGYFEMGDAIAYKASNLGKLKFFSGSFGTGVLAVLVASPCTAPFMGSALGLTLLLPPFQGILIFVSLGLGMALPLLLLAYWPWLIKKMPRSGQWMIYIKQFLSFPLFATCLWLLWVLSNQKGSESVFVALISFLMMSLGIWLRQLSRNKFFKGIIWFFIIGNSVLTIYAFSQIESISQNSIRKTVWSPFNEKEINEKRQNQRVFIDFTASWCITCQVNKKTVLETAEIQDFFVKHQVYLVRADWTNQDANITRALARFGRNSVPLYVYYNKMNEAKILSEILTKDQVKETIKGE